MTPTTPFCEAIMSEIISDSDRPVGSVESLTRDEIYQLFSWYGFRDSLGHELIHCQDFIDIISRIIKSD